MRRLLLCALALAVCASVPVAAATAKSGGGAKHATHTKKKKPKKRTAASRSERGPKGDKGDKGDPGAKGDTGAKGDPGSSVVARARLASPTSTGDGEEVTVPLNGASWTAAPDEADDWAGMVTLTLPTACDDSSSDPISTILDGGTQPGYAGVDIKLGDDYIGAAYVDWAQSKAGQSVTVPISFGGRTLNGDAPATHTLEARTMDGCGSAGQSFTITDLRVNVYGTR